MYVLVIHNNEQIQMTPKTMKNVSEERCEDQRSKNQDSSGIPQGFPGYFFPDFVSGKKYPGLPWGILKIDLNNGSWILCFGGC